MPRNIYTNFGNKKNKSLQGFSLKYHIMFEEKKSLMKTLTWACMDRKEGLKKKPLRIVNAVLLRVRDITDYGQKRTTDKIKHGQDKMDHIGVSFKTKWTTFWTKCIMYGTYQTILYMSTLESKLHF